MKGYARIGRTANHCHYVNCVQGCYAGVLINIIGSIILIFQMCLYTLDFTGLLRTIAAGRSMSTEFPIFILGKNLLTSYGFSRPDSFETELRMNTGLTSDEITSSCGIDHRIRREINFEMNYRALQESVSFLNPFELENSHEGFGRTPLTMHEGASGTEVNAEGFSRTPLTMHEGASGTEVNVVFMNLEQPIQSRRSA